LTVEFKLSKKFGKDRKETRDNEKVWLDGLEKFMASKIHMEYAGGNKL
jgi:hypothetical protein